MKKIIAIMVALLVLALPFASAETVFSFADPVLKLNLGEEMTIDLSGLEVTIAAGEEDGVTAGKLAINGDGAELFALYINVQGDTALVTAEGLSNVYSVKVPEQAASLTSFDLSQLDIDFDAILGTVMESVEIDGDTIRIPYTAINDALATIAPSLEGVEVPGVDVSGLADAIEEMKASNSGVTLEGTFTESETGIQIAAKALMVDNGVAAADPAFALDITAGEDGLDVTIDAGEAGSLRIAVAGEQVTVGFAGSGIEAELTGKLSTRDEAVELLKLDTAGAIDAQTLTDEQSEQLMNELQGAAAGLIGYVFSALGAAA